MRVLHRLCLTFLFSSAFALVRAQDANNKPTSSSASLLNTSDVNLLSQWHTRVRQQASTQNLTLAPLTWSEAAARAARLSAATIVNKQGCMLSPTSRSSTSSSTTTITPTDSENYEENVALLGGASQQTFANAIDNWLRDFNSLGAVLRPDVYCYGCAALKCSTVDVTVFVCDYGYNGTSNNPSNVTTTNPHSNTSTTPSTPINTNNANDPVYTDVTVTPSTPGTTPTTPATTTTKPPREHYSPPVRGGDAGGSPKSVYYPNDVLPQKPTNDGGGSPPRGSPPKTRPTPPPSFFYPNPVVGGGGGGSGGGGFPSARKSPPSAYPPQPPVEVKPHLGLPNVRNSAAHPQHHQPQQPRTSLYPQQQPPQLPGQQQPPTFSDNNFSNCPRATPAGSVTPTWIKAPGLHVCIVFVCGTVPLVSSHELETVYSTQFGSAQLLRIDSQQQLRLVSNLLNFLPADATANVIWEVAEGSADAGAFHAGGLSQSMMIDTNTVPLGVGVGDLNSNSNFANVAIDPANAAALEAASQAAASRKRRKRQDWWSGEGLGALLPQTYKHGDLDELPPGMPPPIKREKRHQHQHHQWAIKSQGAAPPIAGQAVMTAFPVAFTYNNQPQQPPALVSAATNNVPNYSGGDSGLTVCNNYANDGTVDQAGLFPADYCDVVQKSPNGQVQALNTQCPCGMYSKSRNYGYILEAPLQN